jgi:hypothetical protein
MLRFSKNKNKNKNKKSPQWRENIESSKLILFVEMKIFKIN